MFGLPFLTSVAVRRDLFVGIHLAQADPRIGSQGIREIPTTGFTSVQEASFCDFAAAFRDEASNQCMTAKRTRALLDLNPHSPDFEILVDRSYCGLQVTFCA